MWNADNSSMWYHGKYSYRAEQFIYGVGRTDSQRKKRGNEKRKKIKGSIGQKVGKIVTKEINRYI
jgi:hypothetical protein